MSHKYARVLGGDGQTLLQNLNQADPKVEDSLRMVRVELEVVNVLGDCPQPQDAFLVVTDLEFHKLQGENAEGTENDTWTTPSLLMWLLTDEGFWGEEGEFLASGAQTLGKADFPGMLNQRFGLSQRQSGRS